MNRIWKDIPEYEGLYQVSNLGEVKSLRKNKLLKYSIQKTNNYIRYKVSLVDKTGKKKDYKVHRLVAQAFIPNLNNLPQINHIDGDATNNRVDNLEWCTCQDNIIHSYKYLRKKKYNEQSILQKITKNINPYIIMKEEKISANTYYKICEQNNIKIKGNKYWKNKYDIDLDELLNDFKKGIKNKDLMIKYNCSKDIITTRKYQFRKKGLL